MVNSELDEGEIRERIVQGRYRLFEYAVFYWPRLLIQVNNRGSDYGELLKKMIDTGENGYFTNREPPKRLYQNDQLRRTSPAAYDMVRRTIEFHFDDRRWDWNWDNSRCYPFLPGRSCSIT